MQNLIAGAFLPVLYFIIAELMIWRQSKPTISLFERLSYFPLVAIATVMVVLTGFAWTVNALLVLATHGTPGFALSFVGAVLCAGSVTHYILRLFPFLERRRQGLKKLMS